MSNCEDFIFCNYEMHDKFCAIAEILGLIVTIAPHPISMRQLERYTTRSNIEVRHICMDLVDVGILVRGYGQQEQWMLLKESRQITLEDVYTCLMQTQWAFVEDGDTALEKLHTAGRVRATINTFIMQAVMEINQNMRKQLRLFPLDRVNLNQIAPDIATRSSSSLRKPDTFDETPVAVKLN